MNAYDVILSISQFILIVAAMYLLIVHIIPWFETLQDAKKKELIEEWTIFAVRFAEQVLGDDPSKNGEKKQFVLNYILRKAEEIGLKATEQDLNVLVEATVNLIKDTSILSIED